MRRAATRLLSRAASRIDPPPLLDFIPACYPGFSSPRHLKPLLDLLERARRTELRAVISTPPQHGKSRFILAALIWFLLADSRKRHAYVTYAQQTARDQSFIARHAAERVGLVLEAESLDRWRTAQGGGIIFTGVLGPLTGSPVDGLLIVDDPFKSHREAESLLLRERVYSWFTSVAMTRVHPGASVIVVATRWVGDDLSGRLIREGWESINLPAIRDDGSALWEEARPLEWLMERRREIGEYDWWALYMGSPRSKGGEVFKTLGYYDILPEGGYREAWGGDWAYTAKSHADYSVAIKGRMYGDSLYLLDMLRAQKEAPEFARVLKMAGCRCITAYMGGTEKVLAQFFRDYGITVEMLPATSDKFARAQGVAALANQGRLYLPRKAAWTDAFRSEVLSFTGVGDATDDVVDALSSLHAGLSGPKLISAPDPKGW